MRKATSLTALSCLLVSINSAYANGVTVPPVVVHPVHTFTTPVHITTPSSNNNASNNNASNNQSSTKQQVTNTTASNSSSGTQTNGTTSNSTSHHTTTGHSQHNVTHSSSTAGTSSVVTTNAHVNTVVPTTTVSSTETLPSAGYQLNLDSPKANVVLGSAILNGQQSVTINVGGTNTTYAAGSKVTAAEYVAIQQAISSPKGQTLVLSQNGVADAGQFALNKVVNANVTEVVVPKGVTALDFTSTSNNTLTINGGLTNYGSIYDVAKQTSAGTISAADIINEKGGVISSVLPNSLSSLSSSKTGAVDLSLNASNSITNAGTISSSGALNLATTSGAINNTATGVVSAANNVNINAGSGSVTNAGTITSHNANININTGAGADLKISGSGTFQAADNINLRPSSYAGNNNINLDGGNYLSQNLNITSGGGAITGSVGQVSGQLNATGNSEHFIADTPVLNLGNNTIQADPLFANNGAITITGAVSTVLPNENITILANGNISIPASADASISTQNSTNAGTNGSIILVAGAAVSVNGTSTTTLPPGTAATGATVTITGGNGGNIDLLANNTHPSGSGGALLDTSSPGSANTTINGGNVVLVAVAGSAANSGQVLLAPGGSGNTASIDTSSNNGNGGNVTIIAGAGTTTQPPGNAVTVSGPIVTGGGASSNGGNISVTTQQPASATVVFDSHGNISSGSFQPNGTTNNVAVSLTSVKTGFATGGTTADNNSGSFSITAGGAITATGSVVTDSSNGNSGNISINSTNGNVILQNLSAIANSVGTAGNVGIAAGGAVTVTGIAATSSFGNGGNVNVSASSFNNTGSILTNSQVNGGSVQVVTTGSITNTGQIGTSSSSGGTGGNILLAAGTSISAGALTSSGSAGGGNVILYGGSSNISVGAIDASSTTGSGGAVTVVTGQAGDNANIVLQSITTTGSFGGLVEVVDNAGTSGGSNNINFNGAITANGLNGNGGPVALVSLSGGITTGNITTSATTLGGSTDPTSVSGGGVFISSGSTSTATGGAISVNGTINTSVPTTTTSDLAGNIILLSSQTTTSVVDPTNIRVTNSPVYTGGTPGTFFDYGLHGSSATIPTTLNIVPNTSINIRPGGYLTGQGPVNLTLNNPDPQLLAPINIAATGTSITLSGITQNNFQDNINLVTAGNIVTSGNLTSGQETGIVSLLSAGSITLGGTLNLASESTMVVTAFQGGITGNFPIYLNSFTNLVVGGNISTVGGTIGQPVVLNASGILYAGNITTSGSSAAGNIGLTGGPTLTVGNLTTGGGGAGISADASYVTTGNITNAAGFVALTATVGTVETGNISSPFTLSSSYPIADSVILSAGYDIITGNITAGSTSGGGGGVLLNAGNNLIAGTITTVSSNQAGSVYLNAGGSIATSDINASSTGTGGNTAGGNVTISAANQVTTGFIDTTSGTGSGNAGAIIVNGGDNVTVGNVYAIGGGTASNGGAVAITGASNLVGEAVVVGNISTDSGVNGSGGAIFVSSVGSLFTGNLDSAGGLVGGAIMLDAGSGISAGNIYTNATTAGGSVTIIGGNDDSAPPITVGTISTYASGTGANVTGGSVEVVNFQGSISTGLINTSAQTNSTNTAQAGSIGISAGAQENGAGTVTVNGIDANAVVGTGAGIGGDIYAAGAGNSGLVVSLGTVNTTGSTAGNSGVVYAGAGVVGGSSPTNIAITATGSTPTPILFFASASPINSLEGTTTVNFNGTAAPTVSGASSGAWQPGGYTNFGDTTALNLTLNFTAGASGDSRLLLPLVVESTSVIGSGGISGNNTAGGALPFQANGYNVNLVSSGLNGVQLGGNVTSTASGGGTLGSITILTNGGNIFQTATNKDLVGSSLTLVANGGSIGVNDAVPGTVTPLTTSSQAITADSTGGSGVYINYTGAGAVTFNGVNAATGTPGGTSASTFQVAAASASGFNSSVGSLVEGGIVSLSTAASGSSLTLNSTLLFGSSQLTLVAPSQVAIGLGATALSPEILVESPAVSNSGVIHATTGTLAINNANLTNFANTNLTFSVTGNYLAETAMSLSAPGNINFGGLIQNGYFPAFSGEYVLMVAGGNIYASGGTTASINLSSTIGNGGNLTMIAGINYTLPATGTFNDLLINSTNFVSTTGGGVILDGSNVNGSATDTFNTINNSSAVGGGGSVSLFATAGNSFTNSPVVRLATTSTITTGGISSNGDVNLFAAGPGVNTSAAVTAGAINVAGNSIQAAGTGYIDIETGAFTILPTNTTHPYVQFSNGSPILGSFEGGSFTTISGTGKVSTGTVTTEKGFMVIFAEGALTPTFTNASLNTQGLELESATSVAVPVTTINAQIDPFGYGGYIDLIAPTITFPGGAPIVLTGNAAGSGYGGFVQYETTSNNPFVFGTGNGQFTLQATGGSAGSLAGDGGAITVTLGTGSTATITLPLTAQASSLAYQPKGVNGDGGYLELSGYSIINPNTALVTLDASGVGTGSGGSVTLSESSPAAAFIDNTNAANHFVLSANSGPGASSYNAGTVSFSTGGNLTVNPAYVTTNYYGTNSSAGEIQLIAGTSGPGALLVNGSLSETGKGLGFAGTIDLESNSSNYFVVGGTGTNAITGTVNVSAPAGNAGDGSLVIKNSGGGVINDIELAGDTISVTSGGSGSVIVNQAIVAPPGTPDGTVSLNATGTGSITYNTQAYAIYANTSLTLASGGTIGASAPPLSIDASTTTINRANGVVNLLNFATGGQSLDSAAGNPNLVGPVTYIGTGIITINNGTGNTLTSTGNITVNSSALSAGYVAGSILLSGGINSTGGTLTLQTSGANTIVEAVGGTGFAGGKTLDLITGSGAIGGPGNLLQINATNLAVTTTAGVELNNLGTGGITLTSTNTTAGFVLDSQSTITISTTGLQNAQAIVLAAQAGNSSIVLNNTIGGTATTAGITLQASGSGILQEIGASTAVVGNGPMNLSAQTGGIFLNINTTGNLSATGTGIVSLGNLNFGTDTVTTASGGTKWTYGSNGSLILNSITVSNGYVDVLADGNLLQVNAGANISATNGEIILENANTASGSIVIGNSFIHTAGTGGPVDIVIGSVPTSPVAGTNPGNFVRGTNTGGAIYFGANSVAKPSSTVTYNLAGSNIVFNTGARPASAISVAGGSVITADPIGVVSAAPTPLTLHSDSDNGRLSVALSAIADAAIVVSPGANVASPTNAYSAVLTGGLDVASRAASAGIDAGSGIVGGASLAAASTISASNVSGSSAGASSLSATAGSTAAVNSSAVLNAILGAVSNVSTYGASTFNSDGAPQSSSADRATDATEARWITETEIENGKIPAFLSTDDELGVKQGISTVLDMDDQDQDDAATAPTKGAATIPLQLGKPLQGAVSRSATGVHSVNLKTGSVVFAPTRDTVVKTAFGSVKIAAKSLVLMISFRDGVAVFDLDDAHGKAVSIEAGGRILTLFPGVHALITHNSVKEFADVNPAQLIAHRNLTTQAMGADMQAFVSEFSIASALSMVEPLKKLISTRHPHGQKVADHLLKSTAILMQTHQGAYEPVIRRTLTAYRPL